MEPEVKADAVETWPRTDQGEKWGFGRHLAQGDKRAVRLGDGRFLTRDRAQLTVHELRVGGTDVVIVCLI